VNVPEFLGKDVLRGAGIDVPAGTVVATPSEVDALPLALLERCVLKAQIAAGKRGKGGGILFAHGATEARDGVARLIGSVLNGLAVERVLIETAVPVASEFYLAIANDAVSASPLILLSTAGGMDIEDVPPERLARSTVDVRSGLGADVAEALCARAGVAPEIVPALGEFLLRLYRAYDSNDAELLEINPLAITTGGDLIALDCKLVLDDSAERRHVELYERARRANGAQGTALERRAREAGLLYLELAGDVGILANGAGLTMTTIDVVAHYGGGAANFLEIGGDAYTKATAALEIVLANPRVRSLLVNFCGAYAQTDVMARGVVDALKEVRPDLPIAFSIHGTGEEAAIALVRDELGVEPFDSMDDAVRFAIAGAAR
jgi:succinyl-CoA synthetase beta subunit